MTTAMTSVLRTARLTADDALAVQDCFDSQPKVMMALKKPGRAPYADTFKTLLSSGCVAYAQWDGEQVRSFTIVWPWPTAPCCTIVMACNRPTGRAYNPIRSGLQASLDACLLHVEGNGVKVFYYVRSSGKSWKNSTATKNQGRFGDYTFTAAEYISEGSMSKYYDFNNFILGNTPVPSNAVIIAALAPTIDDF
jgi:hypothetical protein